jgi:hypothetical protein
MSTCRLAPEDALSYEHRPPRTAAGVTFVFFNADACLTLARRVAG